MEKFKGSLLRPKNLEIVGFDCHKNRDGSVAEAETETAVLLSISVSEWFCLFYFRVLKNINIYINNCLLMLGRCFVRRRWLVCGRYGFGG